MKEEIKTLIEKYKVILEDAERCADECGNEMSYGTIGTAKQIIRDLEKLIKE